MLKQCLVEITGKSIYGCVKLVGKQINVVIREVDPWIYISREEEETRAWWNTHLRNSINKNIDGFSSDTFTILMEKPYEETK